MLEPLDTLFFVIVWVEFLNDPILLRVAKDEFWFSLSDSDIGLYLQGVNHDKRFECRN